MGIYDTVSEKHIQIKCTPNPCLHHYFVGEKIPLDDGLYLGFEGWFVVRKGKVREYGDRVFSKWGDEIKLEDILSRYNIVEQVIERKKE